MEKDNFKEIKEITKGMSKDRKYSCLTPNDEKLFLRISDIKDKAQKRREYEYLKKLNEVDLPIPKCIAYEEKDDEVWQVLSFVEGEKLDKILPTLSEKEQYRLGVKAGQILRKIHQFSKVHVSNNWYDRYFEVISPRIDAYLDEGIEFEGNKDIINFILENKDLLRERKQCHHHGDYHLKNLLFKDGELAVVDFENVDFENIGDPWYEFNRLDINYPAFASGQIDGYFNDDVPEEFWRLFALYISVSALTSIVWAKYNAPNELDRILTLNKNILKMFDNYRRVVPDWYKKYDRD